jgi:putative Holliday junction resolvase
MMQYSRKMGLDFGKARIGVAFSDLSSTIAGADHIYKSLGEEKDLAYFANLIKEKSVDLVVFGLPLNADGTESEMSAVVRDFAEKLAAYAGVKVTFQDERYTSFEAEEYLKEAGVKWEKRKALLDKISAQIILQNYLDENPKK